MKHPSSFQRFAVSVANRIGWLHIVDQRVMDNWRGLLWQLETVAEPRPRISPRPHFVPVIVITCIALVSVALHIRRDPNHDVTVVRYINTHIEAGWEKRGVRPSSPASDSEWVRRTYLLMVGRIPTVSEVHLFSENMSPNKRKTLVNQLLEADEYAENWAAISNDHQINLARNLTEKDPVRFAKATVNRFWSHFMGRGFTADVDDIGAHNVPSHPMVLERLATEFVACNYNTKQLISWITETECYQLSSQMTEANASDRFGRESFPAFSHAYVRRMSPGQIHKSVLVACGADRMSWKPQNQQPFLKVFGIPDGPNDIASDVTLQALMLLNGQDDAIDNALKATLHQVVTSETSDSQKIEMLVMAVLSRRPTEFEFKFSLELLRGADSREEYQLRLGDVFWALVMSNEFMTIH